MKVSGILRVKGNTLFTVTPDEPLARAVDIMAEKDIGGGFAAFIRDVGALANHEMLELLAVADKTAAQPFERIARGSAPPRLISPKLTK